MEMNKMAGKHEIKKQVEVKEVKRKPKRVKKAKKSKWYVKLLVGILAVVLVLGVAVTVGVSHYASKLDFKNRGVTAQEAKETASYAASDNKSDSNVTMPELANDKDVVNILLIGVDNDYAEGMNDLGNADGLIIVSVNSKTKQVVLTSLMRDIKVEVPATEGHKTKLTLTYHEGGTDELIDTIEYNFGIKIDNYALINYISLVEIIDAMGGVTMDVTSSEIYWMDPKLQNVCSLVGKSYDENKLTMEQAGTLTLNGVQTAAYLRIRYAGDSDFDRTARARNVIMALAEKAKGMSLGELNKLANVIFPCITTDVSTSDIMSLIIKYANVFKYEMRSERVPCDGTFTLTNQGVSYVEIDFDANRQYLYDTIYEGK